jgi:signal transduction histidine kinase
MGAAFLLANLLQRPLVDWIRPNQVAPYPAAEFLLSGVALLCILFGWRWVALVAGLLVTGAGALTLVAYQRGIEMGIQLSAFGKVTAIQAYSPGRVTPNVAVSFVLIGIASVLMSKRIPFKGRSLMVGMLGGVVLAGGLDMVFGYLAGFKSVYGWGAYAPIELRTGIGFFAMGLGLFALAWREGRLPGELTPRWLPVAVALGVIALTLFEWQEVIFREHTSIQRVARVQAALIRNQIGSRLESRIRAVERAARDYSERKSAGRRRWRAAANRLLQENGYRTIAWVDPFFHVRDIVPRAGNEAEIGRDLARDPEHRTAVVKAFLRRETAVSQPVKLSGGGMGFAVAVPVVRGDGVRGFFVAVFDAKAMLDEDTKNDAPGFAFAILAQGRPLYQRSQPGDQRTMDLAQTADLTHRGVTWQVRVWPGSILIRALDTHLDEMILIAGFLLAGLLASTVHLLRTTWLRRHEAESANRTLREQVAAVERAERAARRSNEELRTFTYSVSHDLRAPVRHVESFSRLLAEEIGSGLSESGRHYLMRIQDGTRQMGQLIDDLLNLSRVGRQALTRQETDLTDLVKGVLADLDQDMRGREIEVRVGHLPSVSCDPGLMKLVFSNLLSNAIKFTRPRAHALIEIDVSASDGEVILFVRDNGVGFDMQYADRLFSVFERFHSPREFEGTGIGLATVRRIVERHGGRIWAESEVDKGTTFYFSIPRRGTDAREAGAGSDGEYET